MSEAGQGRSPDPAGLQYRSDEPAPCGDRRGRCTRRPRCPLGRPGRLAHVDTPGRTGQHHHHRAATQMSRAQTGSKRVAVHARQLAFEPDLQIIRRSRRPLLRGLEQARRSAVAHHVYRIASMGARVLINGTRYKGQQHLPGDEAWLIGEHRMSGERKYYLANLPAKTDLRTLAATIKPRWICEQAHQQMKEELGLDHFEGRSWQGLHRHALMTMIAYAFPQHRRLATARREKKNRRAAASTDLARRAPRHSRTFRSTTAAAMPALSKMDLQRAAA